MRGARRRGECPPPGRVRRYAAALIRRLRQDFRLGMCEAEMCATRVAQVRLCRARRRRQRHPMRWLIINVSGWLRDTITAIVSVPSPILKPTICFARAGVPWTGNPQVNKRSILRRSRDRTPRLIRFLPVGLFLPCVGIQAIDQGHDASALPIGNVGSCDADYKISACFAERCRQQFQRFRIIESRIVRHCCSLRKAPAGCGGDGSRAAAQGCAAGDARSNCWRGRAPACCAR